MTIKDKNFIDTDKFKSFFQNNKAVMLEIDVKSNNIKDANNAAVNFYGYPKETLLQKKISDLNILPAEKIKQKMEEAQKNKSNFFEFQHQLANGKIREVEVYASPFPYKGKMHMFAMISDISERVKAQNELKKQIEEYTSLYEEYKTINEELKKKNEEYAALNEEYLSINEELTEKNKEYLALNEEYKSQNEALKKAKKIAEENQAKINELANLLPQAIYECDIDGNLTYVNDRAYEFFGYTPEELDKGINLFQALAPESHEKAKTDIQKVLKKESPDNPDFIALRKDGTTFPVQIYSSPIFKNNKPAGLRGVIIDTSLIKNAEREIKTQNKKLKQITEIEKIGTFDWDLKTNLTTWNDEMFSIHGIPKQVPMPYENWVKCIHPEDVEKTTSILAESITTKNPRFAEFRILRPDGEIRYARASATVITDESGNVTNSIGTTVDITEKKKTQNQIKKQLREIELLNTNIPTVIWRLQFDKKGNFINTYSSDVIDNFLALPEGTVNNDWNKFFEYVKPEYKNLLFKNLKEAFEHPGQVFSADYKILKADGEEAWFSSRGKAIEENNELVGYGTTIDITEKKKIENEIIEAKNNSEENEAKFKGIFDFSPQPISITDMSGKFIEINNKLCEISGYTKNEIKGKKVTDIGFYSKEDREIFLENLKETGKADNMEFSFYDKNHSSIETLINATFFKIKDKQYILSMITDISKRKKIENELINAKDKAEESDRLKNEFINNMSHEIRTPMNGILGFSELLSSPDLSEEKQRNYISIIRNSGLQLMRIIDDILEISKLGTKQIYAINKKVNLNDLLLELFSIFDIKAKENKTALYLKKGLSDQDSNIHTDSSKLSKILSNLLENAIKFTNIGSIEFGYHTEKKNIVFFVKDTGIGIKKEKQEIIFERFSQEEKEVSEHAGGLGLGLSIAKENAELLGGTITLESEKGKGSTFYITIPYKPADKNQIINPKKTIMNDQKTQTILIAEDEEVNFIYIETLLEYFVKDLIVLHAINGKQAVELCKERTDIDFVLMDLKMPVLDGYEATKQIKEIRPDLPIIAQTAYSTPEEKAKALNAGCDDFISKPISKEIFSKVIDKYKTK